MDIGVEVKGGGILEQVRDVEVVVSQAGEVEPSMVNQLLAEPGTKKNASEDEVEKQLERSVGCWSSVIS